MLFICNWFFFVHIVISIKIDRLDSNWSSSYINVLMLSSYNFTFSSLFFKDIIYFKFSLKDHKFNLKWKFKSHLLIFLNIICCNIFFVLCDRECFNVILMTKFLGCHSGACFLNLNLKNLYGSRLVKSQFFLEIMKVYYFRLEKHT